MTAIEPPMLRPLTLSQLLDRAIRLYRNHFLVFIGIIAVALVPLTVVQYISDVLNYPTMQRALLQLRNPRTLDSLPVMLTAEANAMGGVNTLFIVALTIILIQCVATGALAKAIEDSYLGRPITILGSYQKVGRLLFPLFLAIVLAFVSIVLLWVWTLVPCIGTLTGPGVLLFFANIIYPLVPVIVVIEGKRNFSAISRAWELARRRFWWVLGFVIVLGILGWIILVGPAALVSGLSVTLVRGVLPTLDQQTQYAVESALSHTTSFLFNLLFLPLQLSAVVLMYFDLRVRTEGFDLALQAASAEGQDAALVTTPPSPPSESKSPITLNEAGYFAAISLGVMLLCGIVYAALLGLVLLLAGASRGF